METIFGVNGDSFSEFAIVTNLWVEKDAGLSLLTDAGVGGGVPRHGAVATHSSTAGCRPQHSARRPGLHTYSCVL